MEALRTKAAYSGTYAKPVEQVSHETFMIGACKKFHGIPHASAKGDVNKGGGYTIIYAPGADC